VRWILGVFFVLHGLVHLLYFGQSRGLFELQPGLAWPEGSWALSSMVGEKALGSLASILCLVAALGFVAAGTALMLSQGWWRPTVLGAAVISSLLFVVLWDGSMQRLADHGGIAVLIGLAILVAVLLLRWPTVEF
jgi:hypothetical protein